MKKFLIAIITLISLTSFSHPASARGADPINRGPLNVFRRDSLQCGKGWKLTGLIWGDRPVSACMYKPKRKNVFGGDF